MRRAEAVVVGTFVVLLGLLYITKAHQQEIVEPREDSLGRNAIKFVVGGFRLWFGWIRSTFNENPGHVVIETIAIATIFYLLFQRRYDPASSLMLTAEEEEHLIRDWKPESLIPFDSDLSMESAKTLQKQSPLIESATLKGYVKANGGKTFLNLASNNFLGVSSHPSIIQVCKDTISKYGVGSCGPRGFYGTIDTHLKLEHDFARWLGVEDCILYSDGIACIASVIPAFAKKGDLLVCDEAINFNIHSGVSLSRSNVIYFRHNDTKHLEAILDDIREKDLLQPFTKPPRRFIVVEGLYQNRGDICPLEEIVALKKKFRYRLILEDSMAVGVLGENGKGSIDHWKCNPQDVDITCMNLDTSIASVGGVCLGSKEIVDHQRLSGVGYVFSASSPPYTCTAASQALKVISKESYRCEQVRKTASLLRYHLRDLTEFCIDGDDISPIILIRIKSHNSWIANDDYSSERKLYEHASELLASKHGILVSVSRHVKQEHRPTRPNLRVLVSSDHLDEVERVSLSIKSALNETLQTHFSRK